MSIRCTWFRLSLYPSPYPDETGGIELVGADTLIDEGSALVGELSQIIQRADYVRASAPGLFVRGNRTTTLEWEELRRGLSPPDATAAALDAIDQMPATTGWLRLTLPDLARSWALLPAAVESAGWTHDPRKRLLRLRWRIPAGPPLALASEAPASAITTETGFAIATEAGDYFALESAV